MAEFDDDDYSDENEGSQDPNPMNVLRKQLREAKKAEKALREQVTELEDFRQTVTAKERATATIAVARDLGLPETAAKLFQKVNPDIEPTKESIAAFAIEYELAVPSAEAQALAAVERSTFVPITVGAANPVQTKLTREQWSELEKTDPDAYVKAFAENRVQGLSR